MCIGKHEYHVPGMVWGPCVTMMRSNLLILFFFLESIYCPGSFTYGVKSNPPFADVSYDVRVLHEQRTNTGGTMEHTCVCDVLFVIFLSLKITVAWLTYSGKLK